MSCLDEEEKIEYSYTGDVSSLREATEEAINLLDKYDSADIAYILQL